MPKAEYGFAQLGVDYSIPPHELGPGALADSQNIITDASGLPTGRGGSTKFNSTSLAARITSFFEQRTGSTREQLCSYSTKIAQYSSATGEFVDRNTGLTSDKMLQWVNFAGKAIAVNEGADNPQYFTDSTTFGDLAGSPPKGLTIAEWSNRLWFGGDSTDVALLTGSDLNDPTTYTGGGGAAAAVSQTVGDSKDPITGLFGYFDILLVGKQNNIYKVSGAPTTDATSLSIEPVFSSDTDNIGFTSPWAITQVGNDVIFLDGFDIKRLSGIQEFGDLETASIIPHFRDFLEDTADATRLQYTHFFHYKKGKQIWVSIPTGASSHYVFVLDYTFKGATGRYAFFPMGGITVNVFGGVENGKVNDIYFGDETGFVSQLDKGFDDSGTAIEKYFTNVISGNIPSKGVTTAHENRKQFHTTTPFISATQAALTMTPQYAVDLMQASDVRTGGNYTSLDAEDIVTNWAGTGVKQKRIRFYGVNGNTMALRWYHNRVNENFVCHPSVVNYVNKTSNLFV